MGRMFRIISESAERFVPTSVPTARLTREHPAETAVAETVPYIEVGGPEGPVSSFAPPTVIPNEIEEAASPIAEPKFLSVAIHRFDQAKRNGASPGGVSDDVVVVHEPDHPVSREYAAVATAMQTQLGASTGQLLLSAAVATAGTTTVAVNLAATFARNRAAKVVLVDANFLRPNVAERLAANTGPGLAELLDQSAPLSWVIQPTPVLGLSVIAAGRNLPENASSLGQLPRLLTQLREWFDWVLVDAGVWAESIAADTIAGSIDGIYLVSRDDQIEAGEFAELRTAITSAGGRPRGYVTTRG